MNITFMTMGDENYIESIILSASYVSKLYPESYFYFYDWGISEQSKIKLHNANNRVIIINWTNKFKTLDIINNIDWSKKIPKRYFDNEITLKKIIRKYFLFKKITFRSKKDIINDQKRKEHLLIQKPFCMLDFSKLVKTNLVILDADAIIIRNIDEVFSYKSEVFVTLRRLNEIDDSDICHVINSGVIFIKNDSNQGEFFFNEWINRMSKTYEYLIEQTSLTRLLQDNNSNDLLNRFYSFGIIRTNLKSLNVMILPCDIYNFNFIEEGINEKVNIIHFKGGRHNINNFNDLVSKLNLQL